VLQLAKLAYPELTEARRQVLETLIEVSGRDDAGEILKVGERVMPEVVAQRDILNMPCAPARQVYTGVLYQAAELRGGDDVSIFSGLFGVTTADDLIPAYRLSMNASLPGIGGLKAFWRKELAKAGFDRATSGRQQDIAASAYTDDSALTTVDMRSGAYQVTTPRGDWWDLRVVDSRGKVITHAAKHYRGLLTRALLDDRHAASQEYCGKATNASERKTHIDVAQVARTLGHIDVAHDGARHHITLRLQER
jgi:cytoplasmic iron level regulating protein YaaA (DUF328/UPF0246 family)